MQRNSVYCLIACFLLCYVCKLTAQQDTIGGCIPIQLYTLSNVDNLEWRDNDGHVFEKITASGEEVNDLTPWVEPHDSSIYILKYFDRKHTNLITNGHFEIKMSSAEYQALSMYQYCASYCDKGAGYFGVGTSPTKLDSNLYRPINDHTKADGTGKMLYVDGGFVDKHVYQTTVDVVAGHEYVLYASLANIHKDLVNPYQMAFYVNDTCIGVQQGDTTDAWSTFTAFWTSPLTGSVEIKLINRNPEVIGNDVAIDDIIFAPVQEYELLVVPGSEVPVVITQNISLDLRSENPISITASMIDDGSYVECGKVDSMKLDTTLFDCYSVGENVVTLTVWSDSVSASAQAVVEINDPSNFCPLNVSNGSLILGIPKGFSPNGDGVNDYYYVTRISGYNAVRMTIYNRWGNKVYEEMNYQERVNAWDGKSNIGKYHGEELEEGTYYFVLEVIDVKEIFKGTIYLAR